MIYLLMKQKQLLFTDGSVNPQKNIGFGAYLHVEENQTYEDALRKSVKVKKFTNTSSTKLELEVLLWALGEMPLCDEELIVYTDCQNILGLHVRREKFEKNNYLSKQNKLIANHELHKEFYKITDKIKCKFVKVKGHKPKSEKDDIDRLFTLVDKASRNALRENLV